MEDQCLIYSKNQSSHFLLEIILTVETIHEVRNQQSKKMHPTFKLSLLAYTRYIQIKLICVIKHSKLYISSIKDFRHCHLEVLAAWQWNVSYVPAVFSVREVSLK